MQISLIIEILFGFIYASMAEYLIHRYILHGLGKKRGSFFSFHWHRHHRKARKNGFLDDDYFDHNLFKLNARGKEVLGLFLLGLSHFPIGLHYPVGYGMAILYIFLYYYIHMKGHRDPKWAIKWNKWHFDHHMGLDQDQNFGVVTCWIDYLFKSRKKYDYNENMRPIKKSRIIKL